MANEITILAQLSFLKGSLTDTFNFPSTVFTMNGLNYIHRTQTIPLTEVALDIPASSGLALFVNRGPTNIVQIKNATSGTIIPKLKVGEPCLIRFDPTVTAPVAIATGFVISAATNANPVVFTAVGHGLTTGKSVVLSGFTSGWTGCNGTFTVTVLTADTFSIPVNSTTFGAMSGSPLIACCSLEYLILED